jgi:hypothetical protein
MASIKRQILDQILGAETVPDELKARLRTKLNLPAEGSVPTNAGTNAAPATGSSTNNSAPAAVPR